MGQTKGATLPDLRIRPMEGADIPAVAEIEKENFSEPWSEKGFSDAIAIPGNCYLTAVQGEHIVGYCGYYRSFEEATIVHVSVRKDYRAKGVGRSLLSRILEIGRMQGIRAFTLEVRVSNLAAIRLYESMGFENAGVRKAFYASPVEDAFIYWKKETDPQKMP